MPVSEHVAANTAVLLLTFKREHAHGPTEYDGEERSAVWRKGGASTSFSNTATTVCSSVARQHLQASFYRHMSVRSGAGTYGTLENESELLLDVVTGGTVTKRLANDGDELKAWDRDDDTPFEAVEGPRIGRSPSNEVMNLSSGPSFSQARMAATRASVTSLTPSELYSPRTLPALPPQASTAKRSSRRLSALQDRSVNASRGTEVSLPAFAFLFSEIISYTQQRVSDIADFEKKCAFCHAVRHRLTAEQTQRIGLPRRQSTGRATASERFASALDLSQCARSTSLSSPPPSPALHPHPALSLPFREGGRCAREEHRGGRRVHGRRQ